MRRMLKMNEDFIKLCYTEFKKNDEKFPKEWTFEDYKKYIEECNRIWRKYEEDVKIEE